MQLAIGGKALDSGDFGPVGLYGQDRAGLDGHSIHVNRARTTAACVTANVGTCETQFFAQIVCQQQTGFYLVGMYSAVYFYGDLGHSYLGQRVRGQGLEGQRVKG